MALTMGLVQALFTDAAEASTVLACVFIGPTPSNVAILAVRRQASDPAHTDAFKISMIDALAQALASRREVVVGHNDSDSYIYSVELR